MINYLKENIYNTRYKDIDIDNMEEEDKKFFKIGKIDNKLAIRLDNCKDGDLTKVKENIRKGFDHLSKEFYNMQPLLKDRFKMDIEDYNSNTITIDIRTTDDLKHTLPMFMNQIIFSLISSDYINRGNLKLVSKKLYEKYIGEVPKANKNIVNIYVQLMHTIVDLMKKVGYSELDRKKVYNALEEEMGVRQYIILIENTAEKYNIDTEKLFNAVNEDNIDTNIIEDIKKYIDILSTVYGIELETFSQKHYNIVENSKVEEKSI